MPRIFMSYRRNDSASNAGRIYDRLEGHFGQGQVFMDVDKAKTLLDESLSISTELGMRPLMERVVSHQERAENQPGGVPRFPDGLTQREVEVLELICGGKTDREIGEELFISVNTVGNHVRSILSKTDSANRAEAATYAGRHGLITNEDSASD